MNSFLEVLGPEDLFYAHRDRASILFQRRFILYTGFGRLANSHALPLLHHIGSEKLEIRCIMNYVENSLEYKVFWCRCIRGYI